MGYTDCVQLLKEAGAHLWLDNELKGEGSRVPSRGGSPVGSVDGKGEGEATGSTPGGQAGEGDVGSAAGGEVVVGSGGGVVGEGLVQAEPARVLLTCDKGKIVG
jgi:lysophospholipase